MSGTWFTPDGTPRDPQGPTGGADSYIGTDDQDSWAYDGGELTNVILGGEGNDTIHGLGGDDVLIGAEDDDHLYGGGGTDDLSGGSGNDVLHGGAGDDMLNGIPGDDTVYGGDEDGIGSDTVAFMGRPDGYQWEWVESFGGWKVTDIAPLDASGNDGTDWVHGDVEWAYFGDTYESVATPCYAAGTRILTDRGEVPVESLRAGDMLVTLGLGGSWLRPVRWVGHRRVDTRRHARPGAVNPVRLRAGALGAGVPYRDLLVSPDHALYLDGVLVPASALVNGETIRQEAPAGGRITYFHIELDCHDVILADGAPAESWLDCGNRTQFDNAGVVVTLRPDFAATPAAEPCAPILSEGPRLDVIRWNLARHHGIALRRHG